MAEMMLTAEHKNYTDRDRHLIQCAREIITSGCRIEANEVKDYAENFVGKSIENLIRSVPTLAPPFMGVWIEFEYSTGERGGVAIQYLTEQEATAIGRPLMPGAHWGASAMTYMEFRGTVIPGGMMGLQIDAEGVPIGSPFYYKGGSFSRGAVDEDALLNADWIHAGLGFLTVGLMHCKNVLTDETEMVTHGVAKEFSRWARRPMLSFQTVTIVPFGEVRAKRQSANGEGVPWHKVRGHFADYRKSGLFGKYFGIYWVPDHERGNPELGSIEKDYDVKSPKEHA